MTFFTRTQRRIELYRETRRRIEMGSIAMSPGQPKLLAAAIQTMFRHGLPWMWSR